MMGVFTMMLTSMHCSILLIVTIVEIHMLVLDVCVYLSSTEILKDLMFFISVDFI